MGFESVHNLLEALAIAGEEDGAGPGPVADANDVSLDEVRPVRSLAKGLVVVARAIRVVRDRVLVVAWILSAWTMSEETWLLTRKTKQRVRLGRHANGEQRVLGLLVDLGLPVVDVVLLGDGQVAHDGALRVEEFDLGAGLDEAVGNL